LLRRDGFAHPQAHAHNVEDPIALFKITR
jgi:hypothetical protein